MVGTFLNAFCALTHLILASIACGRHCYYCSFTERLNRGNREIRLSGFTQALSAGSGIQNWVVWLASTLLTMTPTLCCLSEEEVVHSLRVDFCSTSSCGYWQKCIPGCGKAERRNMERRRRSLARVLGERQSRTMGRWAYILRMVTVCEIFQFLINNLSKRRCLIKRRN